MRAKLAAAYPHTEKTRGIFRCCGGRACPERQPNGHVACRISDVAAAATNGFRAAKRYCPIRSPPHRIAPARCAALEKNSRELFERTPASSPERLDAYWAGRRFHTGGTCARPPSWMRADYTWPDYSARGNRRDLLSECSLLRIADEQRRLAATLVSREVRFARGDRRLGSLWVSLFSDRWFDGRFSKNSWNGRSLVSWRRFDGNNRYLSGAVIRVQGDGFAKFAPEQRLADRRLIRNNVPVGVAVPRTKNGVPFFFAHLHATQRDDCTDRHARYIDIFERSPPRVVQHLFELGFASHEYALHLLGRFEFKILTKIAI